MKVWGCIHLQYLDFSHCNLYFSRLLSHFVHLNLLTKRFVLILATVYMHVVNTVCIFDEHSEPT